LSATNDDIGKSIKKFIACKYSNKSASGHALPHFSKTH
jgi:hypothetical protein